MSTYQELIKEKDKQWEMLRKKREELESFEDASNRIIKDIDRRTKEEQDKLTSKIKRHFSGVEVEVRHNDIALNVYIMNDEVLHMEKDILNYRLKDEIARKIIKEYLDFYGEMVKLEFIEFAA